MTPCDNSGVTTPHNIVLAFRLNNAKPMAIAIETVFERNSIKNNQLLKITKDIMMLKYHYVFVYGFVTTTT